MTEQPSAPDHVEPPVIESEEDYGLSAEVLHGAEDALEAGRAAPALALTAAPHAAAERKCCMQSGGAGPCIIAIS